VGQSGVRGKRVIDRIEPAVDRILSHSLVQMVFVKRSRTHVPVLAYHGIGRHERFEDHLKFLLRHRRPISLDELIGACHGIRELPKHAVLLSFDDGDPSLVDIVLPLFRERGIPGVAFVISSLVESDRRPWWSEVETLLSAGGSSGLLQGNEKALAVRALKRVPDTNRESVVEELRLSATHVATKAKQLTRVELRALEEGGISIGNHTSTHPCLPRCSSKKLDAEIRDAHGVLESTLGIPPRAFAYPNGDWDPRAERVLKDLGYEAAFLFDHRTNRLPIHDPLRTSRVRVDSATTMDRFRMIVSGLHPALHRLRGGK
jgi:peptidoglycan/xylan/chitin deacetylase (PgdA/CDA1 family)